MWEICSPRAALRDEAFIATKVWTTGREAGIAQMLRSMELLQASRIDLMQVHNMIDARAHLPTLRAWKAEGRIRYLGVTHYMSSAFDELEAMMRAERLDFVQLNYALDDRAAEQRLLPLAAERGIAILVNRPFGGGDLLARLSRSKLPDWAPDIGCTSWAQILLKFGTGESRSHLRNPGYQPPAAHVRQCSSRYRDLSGRRTARPHDCSAGLNLCRTG